MTEEFEEFLIELLRIPETKEDYFLESWGLEQWMIKNYKMDFRQAKISLGSRYAIWRMMKHTGAENPEELREWCVNNRCKLVRATISWRAYVSRSVYKGMVGILMFEDEGGYFCAFPLLKKSILDEAYIGYVQEDRIEILDETFESEEQIINMTKGEI